MEIVDKVTRTEQIFLPDQLATSGLHQYEGVRSPVSQLHTLRVSSKEDRVEDPSPGWWFHHFEPIWRPFIQQLCGQKKVTLFEFERAASQVPGLTSIEKTIAISAFRRQQEQELVPTRNTTPFRGEHTLSTV